MVLIVGTTSIGTGIRFSLLDGEDFIVRPTAEIISTDLIAVNAPYNFTEITVYGLVHGESDGIRFGGIINSSNGMLLHVAQGGLVSANLGAGRAVNIAAFDSDVVNDGSISGNVGVYFSGVGTGQSTLTNRGLISATTYGVEHAEPFPGFNPESLWLYNSGSIVGGVASFYAGDATSEETIVNRGEMVGDVDMGAANDTLDNRGGSIEGDVLLGSGNDTFDNRGGTLNGTVFGGDGNDVFRTNISAEEVLFGGAGTADLLDFRNDGGVIVALDGTFVNAGVALGDTYAEMENVFGSLTAADNIRGNGSANYLFSGGGNDVLDGAGGADILRGGNGRDTLTGGAGNDSFLFMTRAEAGDVITDFSSSATGNNDRFQISAANFGGGLTAGTLAASKFQTRADNLAQDADDRFIFRTTDQTLWYDADGSGSGAAIMIADLQAGATVTYLDILII